ncbi:MAG TPA: ADP-ribosylation factor-like protein, partial [Candidatus Lokiarchaeia archaeon]
MTMLSIISDKYYKISLFFDILKEAENKFNYARNIYKGFYIKDVEYQNDLEVQLKYEEIKKILLETYNKIEARTMSAVIGNFLILGLDRVGKTTILEYLKKKAFTSVKPTLALTLIEQIIDSYLFKI